MYRPHSNQVHIWLWQPSKIYAVLAIIWKDQCGGPCMLSYLFRSYSSLHTPVTVAFIQTLKSLLLPSLVLLTCFDLCSHTTFPKSLLILQISTWISLHQGSIPTPLQVRTPTQALLHSTCFHWNCLTIGVFYWLMSVSLTGFTRTVALSMLFTNISPVQIIKRSNKHE
jgi:hypothetical protein